MSPEDLRLRAAFYRFLACQCEMAAAAVELARAFSRLAQEVRIAEAVELMQFEADMAAT